MDRNMRKSRAEQMLAELRVNYIADLPRKFDAFENLILKFKSDDQFTERFDELFRLVHSLKGSAGTYGLHIFSTICHQFEEQLRIVDGSRVNLTQELFDNCLRFIDLMRAVLEGVVLGHDMNEFAQEKLEALRPAVFANSINALIVVSSRSIERICSSVMESYKFNYSMMDNGYLALGSMLNDKVDMLVAAKEISGLNGIALIAAAKLANTKTNANSDSKRKLLTTVLLTAETTTYSSRRTDPDVVIRRDTHMADNLAKIVNEVVNKTTH